MAAILPIEIAHLKGWRKLWLECGSVLVVQAFKYALMAPWRIRNKWKSCIKLTKGISFLVGHIFREGNTCANILVTHTHSTSVNRWDLIPHMKLLFLFVIKNDRQTLPN